MNRIEAALAVDLVSICEQAGARFHKAHGGFRSHCPLHGGDGENNFSVYEDAGKQKWKCHSRDCGSGDVIDFVSAWRNCDIKAAIEYLTGGKEISNEEAASIAVERKRRAEEYKAKKEQEYKDALAELWKAKAWERYYNDLLENTGAQKLWEKRGVPIEFQSIWQLGYCDKFTYQASFGRWTSPSLVIPIFEIGNKNPINIRHRILQPASPKDKYRPDKTGLPAAPFIADVEKDHDKIFVIEGEIKAMVTYITLDDPGIQIYGLPGKQAWRSLANKLKGKKPYILLDPGAEKDAYDFANEIGGGIVCWLPDKIDDLILSGALDKKKLAGLMRTGEKAGRVDRKRKK